MENGNQNSDDGTSVIHERTKNKRTVTVPEHIETMSTFSLEEELDDNSNSSDDSEELVVSDDEIEIEYDKDSNDSFSESVLKGMLNIN